MGKGVLWTDCKNNYRISAYYSWHRCLSGSLS